MLNQQLTSLLGLTCHPLDDEGRIVMIETPFRFNDEDHIPVFVEEVGHQLRFFDDGVALMHFAGRGINLSTPNHLKFLKAAAEGHGARLTEAGEIELWTSATESASGFSRYVATLLDLVRWEHDRKEISHEAEVFVQEVAQCLAAWKKSTPHPKPKVQGITGREYEFDFDVDGTLVLAISSRHQSTSAALHKLVDVKGLPANQALKTMIIIDDRRDAKAAKSESMILSSVSNVIGMHQLQRNAGLPAQMQ
ncbi:MAG: DUF1828 domain-containing protein [Rhodoferax sp.]